MDTGYIIDKNNAELRWLVYSTSEDWDKGQAAPYIADYCYVVKKVFENIAFSLQKYLMGNFLRDVFVIAIQCK